jgi:hypothetical protein
MKFASFLGDTFQKYIADPLSEVFKPVTDFFKGIKDSVFGMLENIGIPEISFTIPVINKKVSVGPFYPFKAEAAKATPIPAGNSDAGAGQGSSTFAATDPRRVDLASPTSASAIMPQTTGPRTGADSVIYKSGEVAGAKEDLQTRSSGSTAVVNAPTTVNNTTNQSNIMRSPYRNEEGTYNKYIGTRYSAY